MSASRNRGGWGARVKSASLNPASTVPVASSRGQSWLRNWGTWERGTRTGPCNTPARHRGEGQRTQRRDRQTQSPISTSEAAGVFSASTISPSGSKVARSGTGSGVALTRTDAAFPNVRRS